MRYISFILFITTTIVVYGGINYYYIKKHHSFLSGKSLLKQFLWLVLLTLISAPIAMMLFSAGGLSPLAAASGFIGYSWLAFLFLFLMIHGSFDVLLYLVEKLKIYYHPCLSKIVFCFTVFSCISILVAGSYEAKQIRLERIEIDADSWYLKNASYKIVQLSDVHFSPLSGLETANRIKTIIQKESPDIVISTGDLLDRGVRDRQAVVKILKSINPPLGKYAIIGNHEYYFGIDKSINFLKEAGFQVLRDKTLTIGAGLNLVGVDDPAKKRYGIASKISETELLQSVDSNSYTILLKHQPRVITGNTKYFDLQLSGHTHAGQIFPFALLVRVVFKYLAGLYDLGDGTKLYVSRGTGTWGPPFRFLAPPEITVFDIK